jgi:vesicle-associated membrane protein 7
MAIVYALVARGTVVLAEFAAVSGNAGAVARRILEKLPPDAESRLCFAQDRYIFHVLRSDAAGITFLCMANDTFGSNYPCYLPSSQFLQFVHNSHPIHTYLDFLLYICVGLSCYSLLVLQLVDYAMFCVP